MLTHFIILQCYQDSVEPFEILLCYNKTYAKINVYLLLILLHCGQCAEMAGI